MDSGLVLIDKSAGMTSRHYDNLLMKRFSTRKVGHLGTLDPFASGLLVVAVGKATKFLPYLEEEPKSYLAVLELGESRVGLDLTGEKEGSAEVPPLEERQVATAMDAFLGDIEQVPPQHSAVKVKGRPAYSYARKGEEVALKPRKCHVDSFRLVELRPTSIVFTCTVSKGTYVRVLGAELAARLGTLGYLSSLRRLAVGKMRIDFAEKEGDPSFPHLLNPSLFLRKMPHYEVGQGGEKDVYNGRPLRLPGFYPPGEVLLTLRGEPLAVYEGKEGGPYFSKRGLF